MSICADDRTCGFLGAARIGSMCDPDNSAAICQDSGLRLGFVIAHELGHTLVFTFIHSISFFPHYRADSINRKAAPVIFRVFRSLQQTERICFVAGRCVKFACHVRHITNFE